MELSKTRRTRGRVVIIGGGPAGLATAVCLARLGVDHLILESGPEAYSALRRVDPEMRLLSPTPFNRLPGMSRSPGVPFYPTFQPFLDSLDRYRQRHAVQVTTSMKVTRVRTESGHLVVETPGEITEATHVVNATGIISFPTLPIRFHPADFRVAWKHSLHLWPSTAPSGENRETQLPHDAGRVVLATSIDDQDLEVSGETLKSLEGSRETLRLVQCRNDDGNLHVPLLKFQSALARLTRPALKASLPACRGHP